ncbi:hypothetical protein SB49_01315 [Sediminicola sp. YIK13]|nr:hypothetical protein SB49_01315 [Sediminicola sp. YIK13]
MENNWMRTVDLLQANKYIEGSPYWKSKEFKTARGDIKRWRCHCPDLSTALEETGMCQRKL